MSNVAEPLQHSPKNPKPENGEKVDSLFSPGFRSVVAMAGWDEEALLLASLIVEDTPDRLPKQKKRSDLQLKTPPGTNSRRKRRAQRRSPVSIPVAVLNLDDDESPKQEGEKNKSDLEVKGKIDKKLRSNESIALGSGGSCSSGSAIPCMDRLREELSCAICLEICFEPSTTPCGHSFCKKCLRSAADKCGKKCPKCRQLISNGRTCTVNTVLWNTIQLLFPQEVEARKAAGALNSREAERQSPRKGSRYSAQNFTNVAALNSPESEPRNSERRRTSHDLRNRSVGPSRVPSRGEPSRVPSRGDVRVRREVPNQDLDAALALRLQREEFMGAFREPDEQPRNSLNTARANLRAMASRAINVRVRGWPN